MVKSGIGKIVKRGRSQIVLLPADFRLPGKKARVTRVGDKIFLMPMEDEPKDRVLKRRFIGQGREQPPVPDDSDSSD